MFFPLVASSQTVDSSYVNRVNKEALNLITEGKFQLAEEKINALLVLLEQASAEEKYFGLTYQTKAKVIQNLGRYDEAYELSRKSLDIATARKDSAMMADDLNTIGIIHYYRSDYDSTTYYYESSFDIKRKIGQKPYSLAVSAYNLGMVFEDLGNIEKALDFYFQAENYLIQSKREKSFLPDVYVGISGIYFFNGDIEKAEFYGEKAMDVGMKTYGEFNPNMTFVYTSYSNILEEQGKYAQTIEILEKSLGIRIRSYGMYHRWTCESHYDLANAHVLEGNWEKAIPLYEKAIEIGERIGSKQYLSYAQALLARLYLDQERELVEAERLLQSSLKNKEEIFGQRNEVVAGDHYQLARLAYLKNDSRMFYEQIEGSLYGAYYVRDSLQNLIDPISAINSILLQIKWLDREYERNGEKQFLDQSYLLISEAVEVVEHSQRNFSSDRSRIDLANKYREVFETGLNLCWKLYHLNKEQVYLEKAFDLSEQNRNTALLRGLQDIKFKLFANIPEHILMLEKAKKADLEKVKMDLYYERLADQPDKQYLSDLLSRRIELTNTLDSLYDTLQEEYPKYEGMRYGNRGVDLADLQEALSEQEQVLTYFLGEEKLYTFTITKNEVTFLRGNVAEKLQSYTRDFRKKLLEREDVSEVSKDLYLFLLGQQLDPSKSKIIVIADNVLNYLPFETLMPSDDTYLLENYTVSYSGSCRIFLELKSDFFKYDLKRTWAGFAPEYEEDKVLLANEKEVESISEIVSGGDTFLGQNASKEAFLGNNKDYSVLHLAMHAEIDQNNPFYNRLLFSDGDLTASEIYLSENKANLAILSACNTGFGKLEKGEGVMSMARAFHFSGVPAVVMSLWRVPDRETKSIMVFFYKHLRKGEDKGEALRKAKLEYLSSTQEPSRRHPYYWSGFVLNGNSEKLESFGSDRNYFWVGAVILFLLFSTYYFVQRKA